MDERTKLIILFDIYEKLLNDKEKKYFDDYYFKNFSLKEISDNYNVSKNAIYKQIKKVETKLYNYEESLKLYKKELKLRKIIEDIKDDKIKEKLENL